MVDKAAKPLHGVRVLAFTQAWSGPFATELLAWLGAEVIQVESRSRPDNFRGTYVGRIPNRLKGIHSARHPWNLSANYNSVNLNKYGITIDLNTSEGIEIAKELVAISDVVVENFSPRVMHNFGLGYTDLRAIKDDIIMLSISAYGATGPYANYPGIGATVEAMSGMSSMLGYEDDAPQTSGLMYPDPVSGYFGAAAVVTALYWREICGHGQHIDLSMQESCMAMIGDALMEFSLTGVVRQRMGNRHIWIAPHGIYRSGDGKWLAICAPSDAVFRRLAECMGYHEWLYDQRFQTNEGRKAHEHILDTMIADWVANHDAATIEKRLSSAGIPLQKVLAADDIVAGEKTYGSGILTRVRHREAGEHIYVVEPWQLDGTAKGPYWAAPCLGEHSREIFERLLGMEEAEYRRLETAGVTGEDPPE